MNEEEKTVARKNAMCDMDCFNCTRPAERCTGGNQRKNATHGIRYTRMTDGKRGESMPELHGGRGHKCH